MNCMMVLTVNQTVIIDITKKSKAQIFLVEFGPDISTTKAIIPKEPKVAKFIPLNDVSDPVIFSNCSPVSALPSFSTCVFNILKDAMIYQ